MDRRSRKKRKKSEEDEFYGIPPVPQRPQSGLPPILPGNPLGVPPMSGNYLPGIGNFPQPQPMQPPVQPIDISQFLAPRGSGRQLSGNGSSGQQQVGGSFGLFGQGTGNGDRILPRPTGPSPILPYTGPGMRPPFAEQQHLHQPGTSPQDPRLNISSLINPPSASLRPLQPRPSHGHSAAPAEEDRPYTCPYCPHKFKRKHHLTRHVNNLHFGIKPYKCKICIDPPAAFDQLPNLDRHMVSVHHQTHQFSCELCPATFRGRREKNKHIAMYHATTKRSSRKK